MSKTSAKILKKHAMQTDNIRDSGLMFLYRRRLRKVGEGY
jgi:hypothetical protein